MLRSIPVLSVLLLVAGCGTSVTMHHRDDGGTTTGDGGGVDFGFMPHDSGPPVDYGPAARADSDGDGLPDDDEVTRRTDPFNADSDGDGLPDGVEVVAGTDPRDASSLIPPTDFYVVLPYMDPPVDRELDFRARLGKGDIFFLVDTTGSMGLAISNVSTSLSTVIVPGINAAIVDAVMGVGDFRDYPIDPYGDPGDWILTVRQTMTADVPSVQTALNRLAAGGGNDGPEGSSQALYHAASDTCPTGAGFGAACFRDMSHPIIVHVTDADFHNGPDTSFNYSGVSGTNTWAQTLTALNGQSIKIVGVAVDSAPFPGFPVASRDDLEALCTGTSSVGSTGALTVSTATNGMVSTAVVDGIVDLIGALTQDVSARSLDDTSDSVDATRFIRAIRPVSATRAVRFDATTFYGVAGGTQVTFDVTFVNDFQPPTFSVQIYRAYIEVFDIATSGALDRRNVYIVIPSMGGTLI